MFSFLNPLFDYFDSGKLFRHPFKLFYWIIGIFFCLFCLYGIAFVFDYIKYMSGFAYVWAILMTIILLVLAVITLAFWFKRASQLNEEAAVNARFQAIPAVGVLIINISQWFCIVGTIICVFGGILGAIILSLSVDYGAGSIFWGGIATAIFGTLGVYLFMLLIRLLGEQILAIGSIANDTRKIAEKA